MTPGKAYLTSDEIRPLAERSDLMGVWLLLHCWGMIAGAVAVFAFHHEDLGAGVGTFQDDGSDPDTGSGAEGQVGGVSHDRCPEEPGDECDRGVCSPAR